MTGGGLIVQPPRAFQLVVLLHFPDDTRSDNQLRADILARVNVAIALGSNLRAIAVVPVAYVPTPGVNAQ